MELKNNFNRENNLKNLNDYVSKNYTLGYDSPKFYNVELDNMLYVEYQNYNIIPINSSIPTLADRFIAILLANAITAQNDNILYYGNIDNSDLINTILFELINESGINIYSYRRLYSIVRNKIKNYSYISSSDKTLSDIINSIIDESYKYNIRYVFINDPKIQMCDGDIEYITEIANSMQISIFVNSSNINLKSKINVKAIEEDRINLSVCNHPLSLKLNQFTKAVDLIINLICEYIIDELIRLNINIYKDETTVKEIAGILAYFIPTNGRTIFNKICQTSVNYNLADCDNIYDIAIDEAKIYNIEDLNNVIMILFDNVIILS